jgi:NADPH:quinone reductase-like Zn-dependent oxidoreductase
MKPAGMTYEQAAAVPVGSMTALYILKGVDIQDGQKVLVYGASGSVGTFAVQIAKALGAEVTGVCSGRNLELVTSLGAGAVIDYTKEDFSEASERFDVVFDAVGKLTMKQAKRALTSNGKYLSVRSSTKEKIEDLLFIKELIEKEKIRSVIDNVYSLEQIPEAHRYVELGHKRGNVVIRMG